jgi:hypothetical protein
MTTPQTHEILPPNSTHGYSHDKENQMADSSPHYLDQASHTLDRMAARLEILARAWRSETDYMRNGDHSELGALPGCEQRYADAASRSLLRGLANEADAITRLVQAEIPAV